MFSKITSLLENAQLCLVKKDLRMCTRQKSNFIKMCHICMLYICIESYQHANNESDMTKCGFYFLRVTQKSQNLSEAQHSPN